MLRFNIEWFEHILQSAMSCKHRLDSIITTVEEEISDVVEYQKMLEIYKARFQELQAERMGQQFLFEEQRSICDEND